MDLHRHSYEPNAKWTTQGLTEALYVVDLYWSKVVWYVHFELLLIHSEVFCVKYTIF